MFDDWKYAWQQAVENFQRELADDEPVAGLAQIGAMRRDLTAARNALHQLGSEAQRSRQECAEEEKQEQICRRRGEMAAAISDQTTVQIALQWAERHQRRAEILRQKATVLDAELAMRKEDLKQMEAQLAEVQAQLGTTASATTPDSIPPKPRRDRVDRELQTLERERAAEVRLEELKKKMK